MHPRTDMAFRQQIMVRVKPRESIELAQLSFSAGEGESVCTPHKEKGGYLEISK